MVKTLIVIAVIIFLCVFLNRVSSKFGIPVLLAFMGLGIVMSAIDPEPFQKFQIEAVEKTCTVALIFIMFYGGFGTRLEAARPVLVPAGILATVGVAVTAGLTGLFCHYVLGWGWAEGFLMGSVISSTDAASVFSILRSRKLGLKNNTAPMLEVESGSNDPMSYMLTVVMLSVLQGTASGGQVVKLILMQLVIGALCGVVLSKVLIKLFDTRFKLGSSGFDSVLIFAVAILSYAVPSLLGGNGYLSAYIVGILLGNSSDFTDKKSLVNFFDGLTSMMQILIFYMLGTMAHIDSLHKAVLPALAIFLFLTLVARPASVSSVLCLWGRRYPFRQHALVSFVGLRGAASIVFAMMVLTSGASLQNDIFNIVFCIVLISILLQGSLIPAVAGRLGMIDQNENVLKTFSDFSEEAEMTFGKVEVGEDSLWNNKKVRDLGLPRNMLLVLIVRGECRIVPKGDTELQCGDVVVVCTKAYNSLSSDSIYQHRLSRNSKWIGHPIKEYPYNANNVVVLISRGNERIIPNGDTVLQDNDVLTILNRESDDPMNNRNENG